MSSPADPPGYPPVPPYPPPVRPAAPPGPGPGGYGPGTYGPGAYSGYPPPGRVAGQTNTMAVLAIVFAFLFPPLGIVFAAIARRQIQRTGEEGRSLATVSLVLGIVFTALEVLVVVGWVVLFVVLAAHVNDLPDPGSSPFPFPSAQDA